MSKLTKNQKVALSKIEAGKAYSLAEAVEKVKEVTYTKFDASLDIDVRLGVDPRKANQMVRGVVTLPHGTGKQVRVLVLCTPDAESAAKAAGADYVGLDEYIEKIKGGWTDVDVIITQPAIMGKIGALGRVLGPRGLMPNPKSGTVTTDVAKAVEEVKKGKIDFKVDKNGIVHSSIGKVCHNVGDKFVLALDGSESVELVGTDVNSFLNVCTFKSGKGFVFSHEILEQLGGGVAHVGADERSRALEHRVKLGVVAFKAFESFVQQGVLNHHQLHIGLKAGTTEFACLFSVESGGLHKIETGVFLDGLGYVLYDECFIFLFHFVAKLSGV